MAKRRKAKGKRTKTVRRSRREAELANTFWVATVAAAIAIALVANYLTNQNAAAKKASLHPAPLVSVASPKA